MKRIMNSFLALALIALVAVPAMASASTKPVKPTKDIVTIAVENGNFTTLVTAVGCADPAVLAALTSGDQYTVFAPTDAAFAHLGLNAGNVCSALDRATLTNVLLYHVTEGKRFSQSVLPKHEGHMKRISTLLGLPFFVDAAGHIIDRDSSSHPVIALPNIAATNGVIHVVNDVILPINI